MRTYEGALIALETGILLPFRQINCNTTLLVCRCSRRECSVGSIGEGAYWEIVSGLACHRYLNLFDELRKLMILFLLILCVCPFRRNLYFLNGSDTGINCTAVHVNDFLAFALVCLLDTLLQVLHCLVDWNYPGKLEEGRLHYHVDSAAQAYLLGNVPCIDNIEIDILLGQIPLHLCRKSLIYGVDILPEAVKQECSPLIQLLQHVVLPYVSLVVTGYEIGSVDKIC